LSSRLEDAGSLPVGLNDVSPPRLTIEVLFFKNAEYLRRAVESVLAQPRGQWSLIIVDNSVDDREHAAAESLAASYPPGQLGYYRNDPKLSLHEKNSRHLDIAETDLVAIAHGDDEVLPCYAREFLDLAARHPEASVLFLGARIIDKDSRPRFSFVDWLKRFTMPSGRGDFVLSDERSLRSLLRGNWIYGGAGCYRKSLLGDVRWDLQNWLMTSDLEFWCRVILSGQTIAGTRRAGYLYRRHSGQTTAQLTANLDRFREESRFFDVIADRAAARGWRSAAAVARSKTIVRLYLLFLTAKDITRCSFRGARQKLRLLREIRQSVRLDR
jgi:glycosyltransferase involved in cell wall biosynthesis